MTYQKLLLALSPLMVIGIWGIERSSAPVPVFEPRADVSRQMQGSRPFKIEARNAEKNRIDTRAMPQTARSVSEQVIIHPDSDNSVHQDPLIVAQADPQRVRIERREPGPIPAGVAKTAELMLEKQGLRVDLSRAQSQESVAQINLPEKYLPYQSLATNCPALEAVRSKLIIRLTSSGAVNEVLPYDDKTAQYPGSLMNCQFLLPQVNGKHLAAYTIYYPTEKQG